MLFIKVNRWEYDPQRGLHRDCKTPQLSDTENIKYKLKLKEDLLTTEEIEVNDIKVARQQKSKALRVKIASDGVDNADVVGKKRKPAKNVSITLNSDLVTAKIVKVTPSKYHLKEATRQDSPLHEEVISHHT